MSHAHIQPHTRTESEGPSPYQTSVGKGAPPASEALSPAWSQRGPRGGSGSCGSGVSVLAQLGQRLLLTQVLSFCTEARGEGEGGMGGDSRREGGETLKS